MEERHETFPSLLEASFLVAGLLIIEYILVAAFYDLRFISRGDYRGMWGVIALLANGILLTPLLYYKRLSYSSLFHSAKHSITATLGTLSFPILLVIPGVALLMLVVNGALVWLFPMSGWQQAMFEKIMSNNLAMIVTVCILGPVLEEMLFRGVILRSFLQQYSRSVSILASAVLFGAFHLNIYQFVVGFVLGTIAGWLYERSRSLLPCILFHGAYNCAVFWLSLTVREGDLQGMLILYGIASLVLAVIGGGMLKRLLEPQI